MLLGASPLGVYALTQIPGGGSSITLTVTKGDLTLTGKSVALNDTTAAAKGDLTLTGQPVTFATVTAIVSGALTLAGQATAFLFTEAVTKGDLTLTGQSVALNDTTAAAKGDLTLTGYAQTFFVTFDIQAGSLTLTGQSTLLKRDMLIEPGQLTLTPHGVDLRQIGGASGQDRKRRDPRLKTGLEPIKKRKPPEPDAPAALPTPPFKSPPLAPVLEPAEIVDPRLIPSAGSLQALQQQIADAHDISAIHRFLSQREQDEQDARDIADVLALLD